MTGPGGGSFVFPSFSVPSGSVHGPFVQRHGRCTYPDAGASGHMGCPARMSGFASCRSSGGQDATRKCSSVPCEPALADDARARPARPPNCRGAIWEAAAGHFSYHLAKICCLPLPGGVAIGVACPLGGARCRFDVNHLYKPIFMVGRCRNFQAMPD